ncbi:MAG: hypothetical protein KGN84_15020 [Acidobacteriota bacterium]|nr:hypothetical protein [Acidobacteriota bacterium]
MATATCLLGYDECLKLPGRVRDRLAPRESVTAPVRFPSVTVDSSGIRP